MIYLDNAATTYPKPGSVINSVSESMIKYGANPGRSGYEMAMKTAEKLYESRQAVCRFFNAKSPDNIIFTHNCTTALNICVKALAKRKGNFVCSSLEHNAVIRPLHSLYEKGVCKYKVADIDINNNENTVKNFDLLIDEDTSAVILTAASNVFGFITPTEEIARLCKRRGVPLIVDAAQAAGIIPFDLVKTGIDYLCVAAHKGLYAPVGTGILVINNDKRLDTLFEGGTGSNSLSLNQPESLPERFESGTVNTSSAIAVRKGIDFVNRQGVDNIRAHELSLMKYLENGLREMKNVKVYSDFNSTMPYAPVLSFNVKGVHSEEISEKLAEKGICVRAGYHCSFLAHKSLGTLEEGTVRISPSVFTKKSDINLTINCIYKLQY